jgi:hypothetical protein
MEFKFKTIKERYYDIFLNKLSLNKEDLTENEILLIETSYELFSEKLEDIKLLNEEITRLSVENSNLKSYQDDNDY